MPQVSSQHSPRITSWHIFACRRSSNHKPLLPRERERLRLGCALNPLDLARAQYRHDARRVAQQPGQGHLVGRGAAQFRADFGQRLADADGLLVLAVEQPPAAQRRLGHRCNS